MRGLRGAFTLALVTALVASALPALGATVRVRATGDNRWDPARRSAQRGDVVVWRNPTSRFHNVVSRGRNWSYRRDLPSGESVRRRFRRVGTFRYRCTIHSALIDGNCLGMCGRVVVTRR